MCLPANNSCYKLNFSPRYRNRSTAARDASCQHSPYNRQCVDLKETEVPNTAYVTVDHHSDP